MWQVKKKTLRKKVFMIYHHYSYLQNYNRELIFYDSLKIVILEKYAYIKRNMNYVTNVNKTRFNEINLNIVDIFVS